MTHPCLHPFRCEAFMPPELLLWRTQHPDSGGSAPPPPAVRLADFPDAFGLVSSEQIDLWGLGLTVFSMCAGYDLFDNDAGKLTVKGRQKMLDWAGLGAADRAAISAVQRLCHQLYVVFVLFFGPASLPPTPLPHCRYRLVSATLLDAPC